MKIQTFSIVAGTSVCNARCPFCISKMTPEQGINLKLEKTNWINFYKACRLAQVNNVSTVLITGKGEPLLYPDQITDFLKHMKRFEFPLIEVQSNGMILERDKKYNVYLKKWRELGLNTIAISIVHYNKEKNKGIYSPDKDYINLEHLIKKLHSFGYSVRLACIMLKGYIDNVEEIKKLAEFSKKLDVEQLTIRGVSVPKKSRSSDIYNWTKEHILSKKKIVEIKKFLDRDADKLMTLDHGGIIYDLDGQNICLTDCLSIRPATEDLRQLIFFPDGHLRYDWQYKGAVLI